MSMVSTEWLEAEVLKAVPDADVEVIDFTEVETISTFESQALPSKVCAHFNAKSRS